MREFSKTQTSNLELINNNCTGNKIKNQIEKFLLPPINSFLV